MDFEPGRAPTFGAFIAEKAKYGLTSFLNPRALIFELSVRACVGHYCRYAGWKELKVKLSLTGPLRDLSLVLYCLLTTQLR